MKIDAEHDFYDDCEMIQEKKSNRNGEDKEKKRSGCTGYTEPTGYTKNAGYTGRTGE